MTASFFKTKSEYEEVDFLPEFLQETVLKTLVVGESETFEKDLYYSNLNYQDFNDVPEFLIEYLENKTFTERKEEASKCKENGNRAYTQNNFKEAVLWYSRGLLLTPFCFYFLSNRSLTFLKLNEYEMAYSDASRCIQLAPTWPKGYFRQGIALQKLNLPRDAAVAFLQGLQHDPENYTLYIALKGTFDPEDFENFYRTFDSNEVSLSRKKTSLLASKLGIIELKDRRYEVAREHFVIGGERCATRAARERSNKLYGFALNPNSSGLLTNQSLTEFLLGNYESAKTLAILALKKNSQLFISHIHLGAALYALSDWSNSKTAFTEALKCSGLYSLKNEESQQIVKDCEFMINKCSEREVYDRNSFYKTPLFSLNFGSLWPSSVISDIPNSLLQLYHEEPSVFTPLSTLEDIENHFYKREEYTRLFVQTYTRSYVQNYLQNLLYEESLSGSELSAERFISIIVYLAVYIRTFLVAHIGSFMYSMNYKVLHGMISSELSNAANETGLQVDTQSINNALVPVLYDFDILLATPATAVVNESGSVDNTGQ